MKKIFLASCFSDVAELLKEFAGEELNGKTITFIPTASLAEMPRFFVKTAKKSLEELGLIVDVLEVSKHSSKEIKNRIISNDYIYVSGGNTFYLCKELKRKKADQVIKDHILEGKLYIGESAGSMILSPNIEYVKLMDNEKKGQMDGNYNALDVIDFYPVPHLGNFPFTNKVKKIIKQYGDINLIPFSNNQAILIKGDKVEIVQY